MNLRGTTRLPKSDEPSHAPEWRWPAFLEINVNSRDPVMAVVRRQRRCIMWDRAINQSQLRASDERQGRRILYRLFGCAFLRQFPSLSDSYFEV